MFRKYNIYDQMLRAAAGDPPAGGGDPADDGEGGASASANAKTINAEDDDGGAGDGEAASGDAGAAAAGAGDDATGDGANAAGDDGKPKPKLVPREPILKRVGELTRDKRDLTNQLAAKDAEIERLKKTPPSADGGEAPERSQFKTEAEFNEAVRVEAARVAQSQRETDEFNRRCNAVADAGETAYKADWNESVQNLRMLGDDGNIPKSLLDAALEADDPAKALHHLGQNPDEAMRIMRLPPLQQAAAVFKHGLKPLKAVPPKTGAPPPLEPVGGAGGVDENAGLGDEVDDETWMRNRNAQVKQNALAAAGGGTSRRS